MNITNIKSASRSNLLFKRWKHLWLDILDVIGGYNCCLHNRYTNIVMNLMIMMINQSIIWSTQLWWWSWPWWSRCSWWWWWQLPWGQWSVPSQAVTVNSSPTEIHVDIKIIHLIVVTCDCLKNCSKYFNSFNFKVCDDDKLIFNYASSSTLHPCVSGSMVVSK